MRNIIGGFLTLLLLMPAQVSAQGVMNAQVKAACAAQSYPTGAARPITQDQTGDICVGAQTSIPAVTPVATAAAAANLVVKNSAGTLHSFNVSADSTLSAAAWWVMIYNATSAPGDGAVLPTKCFALPSGTTGVSGAFVNPVTFGTGIVIGVSTTGCFTKTASTHAFISAE